MAFSDHYALFAVPAAILYVTHFFLIPAFVDGAGYPYLVGYLIGFAATMALFLVAALAGFRREGNALNRPAIAVRFRLVPMTGRDWLWTLGLFAVSMALLFGLGCTGRWVARDPLLAHRTLWPLPNLVRAPPPLMSRVP